MTTQPIPDQADVVIIGGGMFGVSVAYHLLRLGAGRVVLLEREAELAAATSAAAAGFIAPWSLGAGEPNLELSLERYGMQLYRELANRYDLDFQPVGLAHIATTEASDTALRETYQAHKRRGTGEVALLTPEELHERAPIVAADQIRSTLFVPSGFSITASKAVRALGSELAALGGDIRLGTPVTDMLIDGGVVRGVVTPDGMIAARTVVIAAGPWLAQIARLAALDLPLIPTQASRFVTAALPEVPTTMPMLMFPAYHNLYMRAEAEGLLVGCEEIVVHPPTLAHDLGRLRRGEQPSAIGVGVSPVADTTHHYHLWLARAFAAVVPALGSCTVREVRYGASSRVPDMRHILGQAGELGNLYLIGADLECGMTRGPGLGKALAELIVHEQPTLDVTAYQPER